MGRILVHNMIFAQNGVLNYAQEYRPVFGDILKYQIYNYIPKKCYASFFTGRAISDD